MKKVLSFLMTVCLMLSLATTVSAEENGISATQTVTNTTGNEFEVTLKVSSSVAAEDSALMIVVDKSSSMDDYSPVLLDSDLLAKVVEEYPELTGIEFPTSFGKGETDKSTNSLKPVDDVLNTITMEATRAVAVKKAVYNCYHDRAWFQRKAVIALLDEYTSEIPAGTTRYVSMCYVAESAKRNFSWTPVTSDWRTINDPANDTRKNNASIAGWILEYTPNGSEWWTEVDPTYATGLYTYTNGSGSNLEAGYQLVANNMALDTIKDVPAENRQVIMFTDGEPSCKISTTADSTSVTEIKGDRDSVYTVEDYETIEKVVADESFNTNVIWYGEATLGNSIFNNEDYADNLEDISETFVNGNDNAITTLVENIAEEMVVSDTTTSIANTLGDYVVFEETETAGVVYNEATNSFVWDLTNAAYTTEKVVDNDGNESIVYHYTLKYTVSLNTEAEGFEEGKEYPISKSITASTLNATTETVVSEETKASIEIEKEEPTPTPEKPKAPETGDVTNVTSLITMLLASGYVLSRKRA